jgi:hypothetical protein
MRLEQYQMKPRWFAHGLAWMLAMGGGGFLFGSSLAEAALPSVSIESLVSKIDEGDAAREVFIVRRDGPTNQPLTVHYTTSGTARLGYDYRGLTSTVTIPAGASSARLVVEPIEDTEAEGTETIAVTLAPSLQPFTLAILPDTQYYIGAEHGGTPLMFDRQTQWIVDHRDDHHIAFALHEGDITEDNALDEWPLAQACLGRLDGVVPYALALGNHDGLNSAASQTALFNQFFPVTNYQRLSTFGGVFESNRLDNAWHGFGAGGVDWLVLSLEYGPRDEVLAWANQVVTNHPQRRVIVLTHAYLYYDDTLLGASSGQSWLPSNEGRQNNGLDIWNKFVRHHPNISFVFCGHVKGDGSGRLVSVGDHGNKVYQVLANYQGFLLGGSGWMRLVEFDPASDRFAVKTYSPYLRLDLTDPGNDFTCTNLGLFSPTNAPYVIDSNQGSATVTLEDNDVDTQPPTIVSVSAADPSYQVKVVFSEPVEQTSAETVANYKLSGGIELSGAHLGEDRKTVTLTTVAALSSGIDYVLTVNRVVDRAPAANRIATNSQVTFRSARVLLSESFDGEQMGQWTVVDDGALEGPSLWGIAEGRLIQLSDLYGPNSTATINRQGTYLFWNNPASFSWRNYDFSVRIKTIDDDGVGVLFRYQNRSNYYKIDLDRERNFRQLTRMAAGTETVLAREAGSYVPNQDFRLQVQAHTNWVLVSLDGAPLFQGPIRDSSLAAGTVALYSWGSAGVTFDDVRVTPFNQPAHLSIIKRSDGAVQVEGTVVPGNNYALEVTTDLLHWTPAAWLTNAGSVARFTNAAPPECRALFYRLSLAPY